MALDIDGSRALRTSDQLAALVRAIVAARDEDESRAVEWKSGYGNIVGVEASFALARAILGLSNRPVETAKATFEGACYVVVGAAPGRLQGQRVSDSAVLLNAVRRYTGHGSPLSDPRSVIVDGLNVLVITVEPPRDGDRMAVLHKSFQPERGALVEEGTIFVRQPGATERTSRADLEMHQNRLLAGAEGQAATADMVQAAQEWCKTMESLVIARAGHRWEVRDGANWSSSDSSNRMGDNAQTVHQSARRIRLMTKDPKLLEAITTAETEFSDARHWDAIHHSPTSADDRAAPYGQLNLIKHAFAQIEAAGVQLLSRPETA